MPIELNLFGLAVILVSLIISITLHEMMHAFAGLKLGDTTAHEQGRVSLNPLSHIDPFATILLPIITLLIFKVPLLAAKPVPFNPARVKWEEFGAAIIAFAGPFTNLVLAVAAAFATRLVGLDTTIYDVLTVFIIINIGLFIFNMIPIPPLDGSRILFAVAPEALQKIMSQMELIGIFIVFTLVIAVPGFGDLLVNLNISILNFLL